MAGLIPWSSSNKDSTNQSHNSYNHNPTLVQLNNYKVPVEIISHVISFLIPEAGLCVSNDPDYDADWDTVRALLKTSPTVKRETLAQIFRKPLHVYITSGKRCGCHQEKDFHPLNRLVFLPLVKWNEVRVSFAPNKFGSPPCPMARSYDPETDSNPDPDNPVFVYSPELTHAARCVAFQSSALGSDLWHLRGSSLRTRAVNFKFVFEKLQGGATVLNQAMVSCMLQRWDWTMAGQSGNSPSRLELPEWMYIEIFPLSSSPLLKNRRMLDQLYQVCLERQERFLNSMPGWARAVNWDNSLEEKYAQGERGFLLPPLYSYTSVKAAIRIRIPRTGTVQDLCEKKWPTEMYLPPPPRRRGGNLGPTWETLR